MAKYTIIVGGELAEYVLLDRPITAGITTLKVQQVNVVLTKSLKTVDLESGVVEADPPPTGKASNRTGTSMGPIDGYLGGFSKPTEH